MSQEPNARKQTSKHAGSVIINGEKYPLPKQVIKNIETVISLQANQERSVPVAERALGKVAAAFGRARFLYSQIAFFSLWGLISHFIPDTLAQWDLPVMDLQNHGLDMAALLITTGVLVRQTQQDKIAERRSHLMLQINLLNEQKIAKVIELIEELRADTPDIANRFDWEASIMQQSTDPQVVLDILQENLDLQENPDSQEDPDSQENPEQISPSTKETTSKNSDTSEKSISQLARQLAAQISINSKSSTASKTSAKAPAEALTEAPVEAPVETPAKALAK